ncbi:ABC transporter ATP-binding protein [Kushneria aurantia]|uniref:ABC transporter ATP-binding protein n=1 Tax=Kushneria aurantia TaxID=504092 RepID=A0ABV6G835_9GAMM|nr:ABC transporter ATP-binding protein [Kushneria aurantia]
MIDNPVLRIAGLHKSFGDFNALDSIDLDVSDGEFLAIVGPSGSGKTTLIRLLVGMDEPTEGTIWLRNKRIDNVPANRRPTCMVFQSLALFPHMTVGQNIEFPLKIRGVDAVNRRARALELMSLLQLPDYYYDKRIAACSGGEKQRVALARALAFDPEILFFDEPLSALDYRLRKTLEKELRELHRRTGKTFIYITHSLEEAMGMSDRIAIMKQGNFVQIDSADTIYAHPVSRFVAGFMGEVNLFSVNNRDHSPCIEELNVSPRVINQLELDDSRPATLVVRPENIRLPGNSGEGYEFKVDGQIQSEFNLGSRVQYEVKTECAEPLIVEVFRENRLSNAIGSSVTLGWNLEHCHLITGE